ncbi:SURP and G-patch domain-containing protein 1-like protein isoform X2 [Cryptomeria japonica]|uniref:SURP and G-patch domain-containing protein 1-like protein isoform X2 n=1 Tax=Cryptomeria japonica TaxID=3369 RepID=UPI0027DA7948|nr:SURP and G-patch domain-containing protein 1-like protein isoform X2 [Cryptomeria japonica]
MEGESNSSLFANDGSFLERFKQLQQQQQQQQQQQDKEQTSSQSSKTDVSSESADAPKTSMVIKKASTFKPVVLSKAGATPANGKLAFSLKQKSKLAAAPVKLGGDEEDEDYSEDAKGQSGRAEKRQKLERSDNSENSHDAQQNAPPTPPNDPEVKKVADKLACFVAKNGRQFENITRQKNPGDTPFRFLFDFHCADYKYYEYRVAKEERALAQSNEPQNSYNGERSAEPPSSADPVAMMEYYMKKAAQEERRRPPKKTKDEMPPPPSLQGPPKKGHHMGDYIPNEELEKFLAACNDAAALKANKEATERAKIQADNVGHRLLSKMGWKEGEGLGSGKTGRADPVEAGNVKLNNLGVGASQPGEVTPEDDIYEQYKKRMMLGYRYRPNPLNNPRKAYY